MVCRNFGAKVGIKNKTAKDFARKKCFPDVKAGYEQQKRRGD